MADGPLVTVEAVGKRYGKVVALADVSLSVEAGQIVGLLGHNGAGKSTLVKILAGEIAPDGGQVALRGRRRERYSPRAAIRDGVVSVYQDGALSPALSGEENVAMLLRHVPAWKDVSQREMGRRAAALLDDVFPGHGIDIRASVDRLASSQRQLLEVARALMATRHSGGLLILDEATAAIGAEAASQMFTWLAAEKASAGLGVIFISHRMAEIQEHTDTTVILRSGGVVHSGPSEELTRRDMVELMGGLLAEESAELRPEPTGEEAASVVEVRGLSCGTAAEGVDLDLRRGELVGLGGLVGQGQRELLDSIFVARSGRRGNVRVNGKLAYVTGDRAERGVFAKWSVADNLTATAERGLARWGFPSRRLTREVVAKWKQNLDIRAASSDAPIGSLSGGNQQKVLIARAMSSGAEVLLLDDPTRGVDAGTKAALTKLLVEFVRGGGTCLWYSSEPEELLVCDRIYVLLRGAVTAELAGEEISEGAVIGASFGG